jgi:hypothetical protein
LPIGKDPAVTRPRTALTDIEAGAAKPGRP